MAPPQVNRWSIRRLAACAALAACIVAPAAHRAKVSAQAPASGQQPVFRGGGDLVRVFATVMDRDGRLVTRLGRDVFEVRDEGKPQPITQFDNTPQPIRLIVMLDVSGSMEGNLPLLRTSTRQLIARLGADDVARIGAFGHEVTISPAFTHDADELISQLPASIAPDAPTPLWRALDKAMDTFDANGEQRRVVLVLSDGKDTGSFSFRERPVSQAEVIDRARRDDVMIYAVGMRSRGQRPMMPGIGRGALQAMVTADLPDPGLARVAQESGGGYTEVRYGEDLGAAFAAVADELHSQYLLGYAPPRRDGKTHGIDVRVAGGGMKARARKSYVAPKE
ncbi:MAG TPA: VWA domain-containing protein [Vicinamibacterales bacterium]|nr:VWA domain-containing protein [Vicinamibacterales bacterium]